jgi:hypothetical protein
MMKLFISLALILSSTTAWGADWGSDEAPDLNAYPVLVCVPQQDADRRIEEQYDIDVVRSGTQLKLVLHLMEFETENPGFFNVDSVNPRDRMFTTLRSSSTGVTLSVAKQGVKNSSGEGVFHSVFRGGLDYGIFAMWCTKKAPPPPRKKPLPEPDKPETPVEPTNPQEPGAGVDPQWPAANPVQNANS